MWSPPTDTLGTAKVWSDGPFSTKPSPRHVADGVTPGCLGGDLTPNQGGCLPSPSVPLPIMNSLQIDSDKELSGVAASLLQS